MAGGSAAGPAIVTALLIGDRTAIGPEVRERLQAAGTYHVIAISGGNVAILVVLIVGVSRAAGLGPRAASGVAGPLLVLYAAGISAGPSVWRAVATAVAYLVARAVDHRTPPWNAMAVSAVVRFKTLTPTPRMFTRSPNGSGAGSAQTGIGVRFSDSPSECKVWLQPKSSRQR